MVLAFDSPQPAEERRCDHCGRSYLLVRAFITRDGDAYAIVFAACHVHDGEREAWIDVILGTFSSDDASDHVTFGARAGPVAGQPDPAATAVPAAAAYSQSPFWGIKLSRDEALAHPRIDEFWEIVDYVLLTEPVVHAHVYEDEPVPPAGPPADCCAGRETPGPQPGRRSPADGSSPHQCNRQEERRDSPARRDFRCGRRLAKHARSGRRARFRRDGL